MLIKKPFKKGFASLSAPYYKAAGGGSLGLQTNLTGFWSFENTSWTDDTGNGTTLTGTASPTSVSGLVGNAVSLNGTTQYLSAVHNTNINTAAGDFSVQAWVNLNAVAVSSLAIFGKTDNAGNGEWGLGVGTTTSNVWRFACINNSLVQVNCSAAASGSGLATTGSWFHLVGTFTASTGALALYVNGTANGTATLTGTLNAPGVAPINVGRLPPTTVLQNGLIDQCGFWKGRVLSAGDVTALYNGGSGRTYAAMA